MPVTLDPHFADVSLWELLRALMAMELRVGRIVGHEELGCVNALRCFRYAATHHRTISPLTEDCRVLLVTVGVKDS